MKINIPKGNKFIYLEHFNKLGKNILIESWEHEVLLPRNCKMRLIKNMMNYFLKHYNQYIVLNRLNIN